MIKVFLVEDEYAIREGIKKSVDWEKNDFCLVGEAGDGEMAFPKILKTRPDILITDIRMPFMDGLQLSELVKKELPDIKIVVLSGYDDFNYAKKAISIGVEEYILKPVSGDDLIKELKKISESIISQRQEEEAKEKYLKDMEEIRALERQKFIHDMIDGKISMQESLGQGRELGIDITATHYLIVLFQAFHKNPGNGDMNTYSGDTEEIYRRIRETYDGLENVYLYEQVGDVLCFLEKSDSLDEMEVNINRGVKIIKEIMDDYEDWIYFISAGKPVDRIRDVNTSYRDASRKFADRYMLEESCVLIGKDDVPLSQRAKIRETIEAEKESSSARLDINNFDITSLDISGIDIKMLSQKTILHFLRNGTLSEVNDLVGEYFNSIGEDALESVMFRQYILMESLLSGMTFLDSMGLSREKASDILGDLRDPIKHVATVAASRDYICLLLNRLIDYRNQVSDKKYTEIIEKAKRFIQENFQNEDMSLQQVASYVNVSSNHFSAVFRKETGETFIDYLTRVRMDNAKELLTCTSMKTSEIGFEVGYKDPHYFSYIFKKEIGMSPKEYRRAKKE
ncbi:MAG: response regulator [Eubacterium sp.]|nr:response regulator [Eubacterium sp.]